MFAFYVLSEMYKLFIIYIILLRPLLVILQFGKSSGRPLCLVNQNVILFL